MSHLEPDTGRAETQPSPAVAALGAIATIANHDLHAPLRHIKVFTQMLDQEREVLSEDGRACLARIQASTDRLGGLIGKLVDFAQIGSAPLAEEALDLKALAEAAALQAGIAAEIGALPAARGDASLVARIFEEVFANAVEHAPGAAVVVSGEIRGDAQIEISVADTGPGVPAEHAEMVFEFLRQSPSASPDSARGAGLAICRHIAERHNGAMWLDTRPGPGATFVFSLPKAH